MDANKTKKKRLGRGLESLLKVPQPEEKTPKTPAKIELKSPKAEGAEQVLQVPASFLKANKEQPRKTFDEQALAELQKSIEEQGIMQPILVMPKAGNSYEIIAGERRWRAAQKAGLKTVPVLVKQMDNQKKLEWAIIENIQRDDLNPIEEGEAYKLLAQEHGLTQKEIAEKIGKERATVANLMRITALAAPVKEQVVQGKISLGHAKVLLAVESEKLQKELGQKIERLHLSVRAAESLVKNVLNPEEHKEIKQTQSSFYEIEERLKRKLGTKCKIVEKNGKGKIEFSFYNAEQFSALIDKVLEG